ncbi:hypothetical protein [Bacillus sp. PK3_68]|uniref:hypothetical protein n=1 Tax=Bacillaceae TaxID=186817 RepID=UPI000E71A138|nr:hypothetical protein [Bacillus sp. PK3_68]RJS59165.1 hypothetical protein CJ483_03040 [Bacillus sp. PK3_68]
MSKKTQNTDHSSQNQKYCPKDSFIIDSVICSKEVQKIAGVEFFQTLPTSEFEGNLNIEVVVHEERISQNIVVIRDKIVNIGVVPTTITISDTAGSLDIQEGIPFQEETECPGVCPGDVVTEAPLQVEAAIAQIIQYNNADPGFRNFRFIIKIILRTTITATRPVIKSKDGCFIDVNRDRCEIPFPSTIQPPVLFGGATSLLSSFSAKNTILPMRNETLKNSPPPEKHTN